MAVWYDRRDTVFTACKLASSHTSISVFVHARIYITWFCTHFLHFFIGSVRYVTPPPLIPNLVSAAIVLRLSSPCNLFSPGDDFILLSLFLYLSLPISFCLSFLLSSPLNHFLKIRGRKWTGVTRCRIKEKKKKKNPQPGTMLQDHGQCCRMLLPPSLILCSAYGFWRKMLRKYWVCFKK